MKKKALLIFYTLLLAGYSLAQETVSPTYSRDTAKVNQLIEQSKKFYVTDTTRAIALAKQAMELAQQINYPLGEGYAIKSLGMTNYFNGNYFEAIDHFQRSLAVFESIKDNMGIGNLYNNIGVVYYDQGDDAKALENYLQSLRYSEMTGDKIRILAALNNVGGVYSMKKQTHDKALQYYLKALPIAEQVQRMDDIGSISVNIGEIYFKKNEDDKALYYFKKALAAYGRSEGALNAYNSIGELYLKEGKYEEALQNHYQALSLAQKIGSKINIVQSEMGIGNVYVKMDNYALALSHYKKAEAPAVEIQANHELSDLYQQLAVAYAKTADYGNAFRYQSLYSNIKDTLYNIATDKKLADMQFEFDLQKKQGEINLLTKDKLLQDVQLKRSQFARNALGIGLILIFSIAFIIFRNYRAKVRINKLLDKQKDQIEHLLLNILPVEVAKELQDNGQSTPRNYESVSVLFTDFKGFTTIADKLSPGELVEELNACFMAFDDIIERNDLEKIKTIGDSYMCAGGIPTPDPMHPFKIVKASLEIQDYIAKNNERRRQLGMVPWDVRVGIHVGPIVAGVVGKKKYAYDIWGSTVNIASRMESNGEAGQVNISAATYELIKEKYVCKYRGKIYAKNVGEIDMYFIDHEIGGTPRRLLGDVDEVDLSDKIIMPEKQVEPGMEPAASGLETGQIPFKEA